MTTWRSHVESNRSKVSERCNTSSVAWVNSSWILTIHEFIHIMHMYEFIILPITSIVGRLAVVPVRQLQWLLQRRPALQPRPCQRLFKQRGWRCTSWIPRRWPGPASHEVQWSEAGDISYCTSLHIILYFCIDHYYISFRSLFLHHYYKFLHYLCCLLLRIFTSPLIRIVTSLLHHCYILITSLSHHYHIIITSLSHHYYIIITFIIITQLSQKADNLMLVETSWY